MNHQSLIRQAYAAFNVRDIPALLAMLHPQVRWAKTQQGDYLTGPGAVVERWQALWQEIDVHDEPTAIRELTDGRLEVAVDQVKKDKQGNTISEGPLTVTYAFREGLIQQMDFEQP